MLSVFFKDSIPFYAFYLITIFWILEFIYFPSKNKSSKKIEKKTFFRILFSILFTIFMNIIMLLSFDFFYNPLYLQIISLILYFFGLCLRLSSLFFLEDFLFLCQWGFLLSDLFLLLDLWLSDFLLWLFFEFSRVSNISQ